MSRSAKQAIIGLGALAVLLFAIAAVSATANNRQGLRIDVLSQRRAEPGDEVPITVSVRDTAGTVRSVEIDFGDDASETPTVALNAPCRPPLSEKFDFVHRYEDFESTLTIKAKVVTGGCGASTEQVEAIRTIQIKTIRR